MLLLGAVEIPARSHPADPGAPASAERLSRAGVEFLMWWHTISDVTDCHRSLSGLKIPYSFCLFYGPSTSPTVPNVNVHYVLYPLILVHCPRYSLLRFLIVDILSHRTFMYLLFSPYTQSWPSPPSISSCVQLCSGGKSTPLLSHYWVRSYYFLLSRLFLFISFGFCLLVCFNVLFWGFLGCFFFVFLLLLLFYFLFWFGFVFLPVCIVSLWLSKGLIL